MTIIFSIIIINIVIVIIISQWKIWLLNKEYDWSSNSETEYKQTPVWYNTLMVKEVETGPH